jgi:hypothetical protein
MPFWPPAPILVTMSASTKNRLGPGCLLHQIKICSIPPQDHSMLRSWMHANASFAHFRSRQRFEPLSIKQGMSNGNISDVSSYRGASTHFFKSSANHLLSHKQRVNMLGCVICVQCPFTVKNRFCGSQHTRLRSFIFMDGYAPFRATHCTFCGVPQISNSTSQLWLCAAVMKPMTYRNSTMQPLE